MTISEKYDFWLNNVTESELRSQLEAMTADEVEDAFYRELEFGTAGLRGTMAPGTNRMNIYVVRRVSLALARSLNGSGRVAISYDTRCNSLTFAREAAVALAESGIEVLMFREPSPLPMLSYAIRQLGCDAGVMLTASHNPAEYNGYKCFGPDGGQIQGALADKISADMKATPWFTKEVRGFEDYCASGEVSYISQDIFDSFIDEAVAACVLPNRELNTDLKVMYTPLNGSGARAVPEALRRSGIRELSLVKGQLEPDPDFSTCPKPNPEDPRAFELAFHQAETEKPDIIIATDPDCDRIGLAIRDGQSYRLLTGNETGCLMLDYLISARRKRGDLSENALVIKSIVTTPMAEVIARQNGCSIENAPVGFKYIGEKMTQLAQAGQEGRFLFAFEESCGYCGGMHVRDKDGVFAAALICRMAADYKLQGMTMLEACDSLEQRYGYYVNITESFTFEGSQGELRRGEIMASLRKEPPGTLVGAPVTQVTDHLMDRDMPPLDVLEFQAASGRVIVRPSGTEPKIKVYCMAGAKSKSEAESIAKALMAELTNKIM